MTRNSKTGTDRLKTISIFGYYTPPTLAELAYDILKGWLGHKRQHRRPWCYLFRRPEGYTTTIPIGRWPPDIKVWQWTHVSPPGYVRYQIQYIDTAKE